MNPYTEINRSKNSKLPISFLAIAHFFIAAFYTIQQLINIRNSLHINDDFINKAVIDAAAYISLGISAILVLTNIIAGIGILRMKSWSWWLSVSFFFFLLIQKFVTFLFGLYTKIFVLGIGEDTLFLREFDFILNSLYVLAISIIVLIYLNDNQVYISFKKDISSKKRNFLICFGIAFAFIFLNTILGHISNLLS